MVSQGWTFNGLVIRDEYGSSVTDFYRDYVVDGPNSFLQEVKDWKDFPGAIRIKLLQEIS
jgi:hypothetical protein